jgi:hypothetical protein
LKARLSIDWSRLDACTRPAAASLSEKSPPAEIVALAMEPE